MNVCLDVALAIMLGKNGPVWDGGLRPVPWLCSCGTGKSVMLFNLMIVEISQKNQVCRKPFGAILADGKSDFNGSQTGPTDLKPFGARFLQLWVSFPSKQRGPMPQGMFGRTEK